MCQGWAVTCNCRDRLALIGCGTLSKLVYHSQARSLHMGHELWLQFLFFFFSFSFPGPSPITTIFPLLDLFSWAPNLTFPRFIGKCLSSQFHKPVDSFLFKPSRNEWDSPGAWGLPPRAQFPWGPHLKAVSVSLHLWAFPEISDSRSAPSPFIWWRVLLSRNQDKLRWFYPNPGSSVNHFSYHCLWSYMLPSPCFQNLQAPLPVEWSQQHTAAAFESRTMNRTWLWRANAILLHFQMILWTIFPVPYL